MNFLPLVLTLTIVLYTDTAAASKPTGHCNVTLNQQYPNAIRYDGSQWLLTQIEFTKKELEL